MISSKRFESVDGATSRFLSDFIISSEQHCRVYMYKYNPSCTLDTSCDTVIGGVYVREFNIPQSADIVTIDKWDLVDNSIVFYTTPSVGLTIVIEVATTPEEFGDVVALPNAITAQTYAESASVSASSASVSATSASVSATSAATSATSALASKNSATTSATSASNSAITATTQASTATTKATAAATSATSAATSATAAAISATSATTSATTATTKAAEASTSATSALASKNSATTSATTATTKAAEAAASAASALASELAATAIVTAPLVGAIGNINSPLLDMPLKNSLAMKAGVGSATFTRASTATYIDRYGVLKTAAIDEPRFEKEGYLNEGASTNLFTYSEDFSNAAWTRGNVTISVNTADTLDPYGTNLADKLINTAIDAYHQVNQVTASTITSGVGYTASMFVKAGTFSVLQIVPNSSPFGTAHINFDLNTGTISNQLGLITGTITPYANGWFRCTATITAIASGSTSNFFYGMVPSPTSARALSYLGTITDSIYIFGAQLE